MFLGREEREALKMCGKFHRFLTVLWLSVQHVSLFSFYSTHKNQCFMVFIDCLLGEFTTRVEHTEWELMLKNLTSKHAPSKTHKNIKYN